MDAVTVSFLATGGVALVLMLLSFTGRRTHLGRLHLGRLHLGRLHLGHLRVGHVRAVPRAGHITAGRELTLPAMAGFLGMFGFGGAVAASLSTGSTGSRTLLATAVGVAVGVPSAWLANRLVDAAMNMPTDATPTSGNLVGATGVVILDVPVGGYGEVRLHVAGQPMKFYARADQPLARGTAIFVIAVPSPTSVLVEPTPGALAAPSSKEGQ
jgi:membrane protein implicated in regulation of membrane protease activity